MTVTKADLRPRCRAAVLEALEQLGGWGTRPDVLVLAERLAGFSNAELELPAPPAATTRFKRFVDHQLAAALTGCQNEGLVDNPDAERWELCAPSGAGPERGLVPAPPDTARVRERRAMTLRDDRGTPERDRARAEAVEYAGRQRDPGHAGRRRSSLLQRTLQRLR